MPAIDICLLIMLIVHIGVCVGVLITEAHFYPEYHVFFDATDLNGLLLGAAAFVLIGSVFLVARFSFGYLLAYHFYLVLGGFLWLNYFTDFSYNHVLAGASAIIAGLAFLGPALFLHIKLPRVLEMSDRSLSILLKLILGCAAMTLVVASRYNFRLVDFASDEALRLRDELALPGAIRYLLGITSAALLPFAFACFVLRKSYVGAAITVVLLACYYPITMNKLAFFTPAWLILVTIVSRFLQPRAVCIFLFLVPMSIGLIFAYLPAPPYLFWLLDHRMFVVPASALAVYNEFFSKHAPTFFCQISLVKALTGCPYGELGPMFKELYGQGNYNAGLFATEGVASVGPILAPVSALFCSLVVVLANAASSHLPKRLVLISGAAMPHIFLNVPFSVALLSSGAAILFLLWYLTGANETMRDVELYRSGGSLIG